MWPRPVQPAPARYGPHTTRRAAPLGVQGRAGAAAYGGAGAEGAGVADDAGGEEAVGAQGIDGGRT